MIKLAIVGAFCTGKTTLVNDLHRALPNCTVVADECRPLLDTFNVVDWSNPDVRSYLVVRQLMIEKAVEPDSEYVVVDGGVINNIAHDRILLDPAPSRDRLLTEFDHQRYDLVVHCSPEGVTLVDDGQRYVDTRLRTRLRESVEHTLNVLDYRALTVRGDRRQRLMAVVQELRSSDATAR